MLHELVSVNRADLIKRCQAKVARRPAPLGQNAFKFTREAGQVVLRAKGSDNRVLIEIEDECGGLPPGAGEIIFRPFKQATADQRGVGLGLAITRRSVEADGGKLSVRDIPGHGCIFTIDMPRFERRLAP
jgi:signal transduction histidine kinase